MRNETNRQVNREEDARSLRAFLHHAQKLIAQESSGDSTIESFGELEYRLLRRLDGFYAAEVPPEAFPLEALDAVPFLEASVAPSSACSWQKQGSGFTCETGADAALAAASSITERFPILRGTEELAFCVEGASCAGEACFTCWFGDNAGRFIGVDFIPCQDGVYRIDVPERAATVLLGLKMAPSSSVRVQSVRVPKHVIGRERISLENFPLCSNSHTARVYESIFRDAEAIPDSNGSGYYRGPRPRVGIITDDFMFNYYAGALDLVYIEKARYREIIDNDKLEMILYVTCWRGMLPPDEEGHYEYTVGETARFMPEFAEYAHRKGLKILFQSIEDPPNYATYLPIAKEADFIFTTAVEMVPRYIADTGNHRVYFQPYGVNPAIHNPIGFMKRRSMDLYRDSVFFAGSWYGSFKNRCDDTSRIFDGVIEGGKDLIVADRSLDYARRDGRIFPSKYNEYIIPPLDHAVLQKVHKLFDFAVNLNSVTDSETMGAMRVLEVQALGSLLISNYSKSLENFYPDVCVVREKEDAGEYLAALDEKEIVRRQIAGIRRMFSEATVYDRLNLMLLRIGYPRLFEDKTVYVLYEDLTESIESQFRSQRYRKKELVSLSEFQERGIRDGYAVLLRDGGCLDEYFLVDAVNAFKFTDVSYVAAVAIDDYGTGYDYATGTQGKFDTLYALDKVTLDGNGIEGLAGDGELDGFLIAL